MKREWRSGTADADRSLAVGKGEFRMQVHLKLPVHCRKGNECHRPDVVHMIPEG